MSDIERKNNIRPDVGGIIAGLPQFRNSADARKLNLTELDEWLKDNTIMYPLIGVATISAGWLAYRFIERILSGRLRYNTK